jgi:hypothetical protein
VMKLGHTGEGLVTLFSYIDKFTSSVLLITSGVGTISTSLTESLPKHAGECDHMC